MGQRLEKKADRYDGDQFPIHYEKHHLQVFTNPSGELFVEDTRSGAQMRMRATDDGEIEFTSKGPVEPTIVNGHAIGWRVKPLMSKR